MKLRRRGATVCCVLLALLLILPLTAEAAVPKDELAGSPEVPLTYGGKTLGVSARRVDGYLMVPLSDFAAQFTTATCTYSATTQYATLKTPGMTLTAGRGGTFLTANDRTLYGVAANRLVAGKMWVPLNPLAKALGLSVRDLRTSATVSGTYRALTPGSAFYNAQDLFWLSRLISAESRGEPLRGQIAVGGVIMNRVRSTQFPGTVKGVIFERGQFSTVANGTVYDAPAWTSLCAAKMCLEGYAISNDVLFFCNLTVSPSNWITRNRKAAFSIGAHTFFF